MKLRGKHVILAFVLLVTGFLVSYSYTQADESSQMVKLADRTWEKEYYYRKQLLDLESKNKELREELQTKTEAVQTYEDGLAANEQQIADFVERKKRLQMLTGQLPVKGPGLSVTLKDAAYIPSEEHANNYIVHEPHIHQVVNELKSAGAKAIAINGQRYVSNSYFACTGPVITIDGVQHPAPFVITAIGDPDVLFSSLSLKNGVVDQLVTDNIEVELEKSAEIQMDARLSSEG
ncbi:UPF0749 protein YlxW [Thalassobacillus devorans]|uniref:UPF0749 protein YlxW n=1 Tax=Thalassobacillus devorans TaxID=279813 RepID=A0ABQ1NNE3_9BACI|nr:DUF881 domain-containing protein [Thalassobacillus devorans]NIK27816.1 uncharacterized protein YlxW (UPF0749 family) [Thalassobacillus devorans]GGC80667.1 UPF0749 protein YlxW [Thalassobacillus devorans]